MEAERKNYVVNLQCDWLLLFRIVTHLAQRLLARVDICTLATAPPTIVTTVVDHNSIAESKEACTFEPAFHLVCVIPICVHITFASQSDCI